MRSSPLRGTGDCRLLWDGIVKSVLALCLMCTSYAGVGALKCTPCNPSMCPDPPKNCPRGTILDVCGCCQVCGKNVNETCGGPFEIVGKCGDGLECALTSEVGGSITGSEKGICREIISKKCEKVKCADIAIKRKCPMDSTLVQVEHVNSCCKGSYQCVCNMNFCKKTRCAPGFESVLHHSAEGHPGLCCDQYVCQLSGCLTGSGDVVHNATWQEDDCTSCRCVNGKAECKSMFCETRCSSPRRISGQCCPVCDDDDSFRKRDQCPDLNKCSLNCLSGFQLNEESCYICKCKPANCYLDCKDGYKLDSKGMEICECAKPYSICPSLENCKKQCTYGLKVANNGCQKCSCNKCPPFSCGKKCANGYTENHQDCKLCKCKDNSRLNNTPSRYDSKHTGKSCLSVEGQLHEDGDSWHDGCRMCYCYGGQEMCALISCPHPSCTSPVFRLGDCCLSCPGNIVLPHKGKREMCESLNGRYFVEGETWYLDNCTQCLCHSSSILCETQACPPLLCSYPTILPNTCCPVCQEEDKSLKTFSLPHKGICHTNNRFVYSDGDVWKTNPCQSCTCRSGQVHCVSQVCPAVTCPKSVLRKGSCCPTCLDLSHQKVCTDEGVKYTSGEHWLRNNCTKCYCIDGKIVCVEQSCPTIHCKYMTSIPGDCCPVCLDEQTTIEEQTLPEPGPSVIVKEEAEKDPIKNNKNATTIIICVLAAMVIILLLLLVFFFLFKYGKWKSVSKKYSPKSVDIENIHPVQVKLLGYEMSVKPVKKSEQSWNPDLLPVSKLNNEEKHVNLLSQEFDKTKLCQI